MTDEERILDIAAIIRCLARHEVDFLLVGGVAASMQGASRPTYDLDALPSTAQENLDRLGAALRELGAWLRVDGLTDEEARALPTRIDGAFLATMDISAWRTPYGDVDILTGIPDRQGGRRFYEELHTRSTLADVDGVSVWIASLADIIDSKTWADRPKDRAALPELHALLRRSSGLE